VQHKYFLTTPPTNPAARRTFRGSRCACRTRTHACACAGLHARCRRPSGRRSSSRGSVHGQRPSPSPGKTWPSSRTRRADDRHYTRRCAGDHRPGTRRERQHEAQRRTQARPRTGVRQAVAGDKIDGRLRSKADLVQEPRRNGTGCQVTATPTWPRAARPLDALHESRPAWSESRAGASSWSVTDGPRRNADRRPAASGVGRRPVAATEDRGDG